MSRAISIKKVQVYFTSRTLFLQVQTNLKYLQVPVTNIQLVFTHGILLNLIAIRRHLHSHSAIVKKVHFFLQSFLY